MSEPVRQPARAHVWRQLVIGVPAAGVLSVGLLLLAGTGVAGVIATAAIMLSLAALLWYWAGTP